MSLSWCSVTGNNHVPPGYPPPLLVVHTCATEAALALVCRPPSNETNSAEIFSKEVAVTWALSCKGRRMHSEKRSACDGNWSEMMMEVWCAIIHHPHRRHPQHPRYEINRSMIWNTEREAELDHSCTNLKCQHLTVRLNQINKKCRLRTHPLSITFLVLAFWLKRPVSRNSLSVQL